MIKNLNALLKNDLEATKNLLRQFKEANGINKGVSVTALDFTNWLEKRQEIGLEYLNFLLSMNVSFDNPFCAEVGKTCCDSLVLPYRTSIMTPYTEGFNLKYSKVIPGKFEVVSGLPFLERKDGKQLMIPNVLTSTYMTQNPYTSECIFDWEDLHNSGIARIIVGYYGNTFDKDKEEKLKQLKDLKEKLIGEYFIEYDELGDTYYSVVASCNSKTKVKTKTLESNIIESQTRTLTR